MRRPIWDGSHRERLPGLEVGARVHYCSVEALTDEGWVYQDHPEDLGTVTEEYRGQLVIVWDSFEVFDVAGEEGRAHHIDQCWPDGVLTTVDGRVKVVEDRAFNRREP